MRAITSPKRRSARKRIYQAGIKSADGDETETLTFGGFKVACLRFLYTNRVTR
jgi:hypothetical protein